MSNSLVTETIVSGEQIAPIIANLEAAADGCQRDHLIIALISMTLICTYPEISQQQLQTAVRDVSRYICLVLDPSADTDLKPSLMN